MIKELARMRFQSSRAPEESGVVVITEDGCLQVEPSEKLIDNMAALEEKAVHRSRLAGMAATLFFFGIGAIIAAIAWAMGRLGGEMRTTLTRPRIIEDVLLESSTEGGIRVVLHGDGPQRIVLQWERGEFDQTEAEQLLAVYDRYKQFPAPKPTDG